MRYCSLADVFNHLFFLFLRGLELQDFLVVTAPPIFYCAFTVPLCIFTSSCFFVSGISLRLYSLGSKVREEQWPFLLIKTDPGLLTSLCLVSTALSHLHAVSHWNPCSNISPILQLRNLMHNKVKQCASCHTVNGRQSLEVNNRVWILNSNGLNPEFMLITISITFPLYHIYNK